MFKCYSEDESRAILYYVELVRDYALDLSDVHIPVSKKVARLTGYITAVEDTAKDLSDCLTYEADNMGSGDIMLRMISDIQGVFERSVVYDSVRDAFRREGWI